MSVAREEVLRRIRAALAPSPGAPSAPLASPSSPAVDGGGDASSRRSGTPVVPDRRIDLFVERVEDYRATVTRTTADELPQAIAAICRRHRVARLAVPAGLPEAWVPQTLVIYASSDPAVLDTVDGVLTASAFGVAETGTIVLDGGAGQGPRAATLLPDLHLCVVRDVVAGVPEMTERMGAAVREHGRPLTMISGPSATSDIELDRVEGVHGPRRLEVLVVGGP